MKVYNTIKNELIFATFDVAEIIRVQISSLNAESKPRISMMEH